MAKIPTITLDVICTMFMPLKCKDCNQYHCQCAKIDPKHPEPTPNLKKINEEKKPHKCKCDTWDLMQHGCKCGGI